MASKIYGTAGDTNRSFSVVLKDDGTARNLTTADAIECHLKDRSAGTVTVITGLTGDASGVVTTTVATLTEGTFTVEYEVTEGSTITTSPGDGSTRPLLIVRAEAN